MPPPPSPGLLLILGFIAILVHSSIAIPIFPDDSVDCSPTTWTDILSFFLLNYVAHAATTPSPPGVNWWGSFQYPFISVLFPFAGLGRASSIIFNNAYYGVDDLGKALSVGALAVAVRTKNWNPLHECGERLVCDSLPSQFLEDSRSASRISSPRSTVNEAVVEEEEEERYDL